MNKAFTDLSNLEAKDFQSNPGSMFQFPPSIHLYIYYILYLYTYTIFLFYC